MEGNSALCGQVLIESNFKYFPDRITSTESLIATTEQNQTEIVLTNLTRITQQLEAGVNLGHASEVVVPQASLTSEMDDTGKITHVGGNNKEADYLTSVLTVKTLDVHSRKEKLGKLCIEEQGHRNWPSRPGKCWTKVSCTSREPTISSISH